MKPTFCRAIVLLICAGCLVACYGPNPIILRQELRPPSAPNEPYTLAVTIANQNGGEGEAAVTARLLSKRTGETAAQSNEMVELRAHETVQLVLDLQPAAAGEYDATVEIQYPPE
jgi:hypothetical protein